MIFTRLPQSAMAPSAVEANETIVVPKTAPSTHREPLRQSGALDGQAFSDVTPTIGREFPTASLVEWLDSPNSDALLRDLAITSKGTM